MDEWLGVERYYGDGNGEDGTGEDRDGGGGVGFSNADAGR